MGSRSGRERIRRDDRSKLRSPVGLEGRLGSNGIGDVGLHVEMVQAVSRGDALEAGRFVSRIWQSEERCAGTSCDEH